MKHKKLIYEYKNYREFLRDRFAELKSQNKNFSFRYFSMQAGFKSQSVLKQVLDGQINIADKSIEKYVKAMRLDPEEAFYFEHLVKMNQAKDPEDLKTHAKQLLKSKKFKELYPLSAAQLNYYQNWYYIPIRELVGLKGFREDFEWMAKKIQPNISAREAKEAIRDLVELGLVLRGQNGELLQVNPDISTGDTVISDLVRNYHREMIKKAGSAIDLFARELRDISAIALSVSDQDYDSLKAVISRFRKDIIKIAAETADRNQVYQLNIQFFPLTEKTDGSDDKL